jgi:hypothetical protein
MQANRGQEAIGALMAKLKAQQRYVVSRDKRHIRRQELVDDGVYWRSASRQEIARRGRLYADEQVFSTEVDALITVISYLKLRRDDINDTIARHESRLFAIQSRS